MIVLNEGGKTACHTATLSFLSRISVALQWIQDFLMFVKFAPNLKKYDVLDTTTINDIITAHD